MHLLQPGLALPQGPLALLPGQEVGMDREQARQLGRTLAKSTAHMKVLVEIFVDQGAFTMQDYSDWMDGEDRFLQGRPFEEVLRMVLGQEGETITEVPGADRDGDSGG